MTVRPPEQLYRNFRDCGMRPEDLDYINERRDELDSLQGQIEDAKIDSYVKEEAVFTANRLIMSSGIFDITARQTTYLESVIAFASRHNIEESEIESIYSDAGAAFTDIDNLVYTFLILTSLRVAEQLNWEYRSVGGISKNTDDFTRAVSAAIVDGRITIRARDRIDEDINPNGFAYYMARENQIVLPPLEEAPHLALMFQYIIHESYHAYQDMNPGPVPLLITEMEAYERGTRADILRQGLYSYGSDTALAEINDERQYLKEWEASMMRQLATCMGFPSALESHDERLNSNFEFYRDSWYRALHWEIGASSNSSSRALLSEAIRYSNYAGLWQNFLYYWLAQIQAGAFSGSAPTDEEVMTALREKRAGIVQTGVSAGERGMAALDYLSSLAAVYVLSFHDGSHELLNRIEDVTEADFDIVSSALLYTPVVNDGVE